MGWWRWTLSFLRTDLLWLLFCMLLGICMNLSVALAIQNSEKCMLVKTGYRIFRFVIDLLFTWQFITEDYIRRENSRKISKHFRYLPWKSISTKTATVYFFFS